MRRILTCHTEVRLQWRSSTHGCASPEILNPYEQTYECTELFKTHLSFWSKAVRQVNSLQPLAILSTMAGSGLQWPTLQYVTHLLNSFCIRMYYRLINAALFFTQGDACSKHGDRRFKFCESENAPERRHLPRRCRVGKQARPTIHGAGHSRISCYWNDEPKYVPFYGGNRSYTQSTCTWIHWEWRKYSSRGTWWPQTSGKKNGNPWNENCFQNVSQNEICLLNCTALCFCKIYLPNKCIHRLPTAFFMCKHEVVHYNADCIRIPPDLIARIFTTATANLRHVYEYPRRRLRHNWGEIRFTYVFIHGSWAVALFDWCDNEYQYVWFVNVRIAKGYIKKGHRAKISS